MSTSPDKKPLYPIVGATVALFTLLDMQLKVLLVSRGREPHGWALPGGVLNPDSDASLDHTALRELAKKTEVSLPHLEQVRTYSGPGRDPRGWSVSTLYYALLPSDKVPAVAGSRTEAIEWCNPERPGHRLVFDHAAMLPAALSALRDKVERGALPLHLLPARFTLTELQHACEAILGRELDKGAFRRQLKQSPCLEKIEGEFQRGPQRPAQIYRATRGFTF
ncbi:MAG: NUDIX domain-containing protein [Rhodanobacteraceae bacterium]